MTGPVATGLEQLTQGLFARAPAVQQERNLEVALRVRRIDPCTSEDSLLEEAGEPVTPSLTA